MARIANTAERKAAPPRMSKGSGALPPWAWPMVMVKMTKVAPIRMLAFWSAMAESWTWLCCTVRTRCAAFAEKVGAGPGSAIAPVMPEPPRLAKRRPHCRPIRLAEPRPGHKGLGMTDREETYGKIVQLI